MKSQEMTWCNYGRYEWKGKDFVMLGGIRYLVRWETDDRMILTLPYGKIAYVAPVRNGEVVGLPITKGVLLSGDERYF